MVLRCFHSCISQNIWPTLLSLSWKSFSSSQNISFFYQKSHVLPFSLRRSLTIPIWPVFSRVNFRISWEVLFPLPKFPFNIFCLSKLSKFPSIFAEIQFLTHFFSYAHIVEFNTIKGLFLDFPRFTTKDLDFLIPFLGKILSLSNFLKEKRIILRYFGDFFFEVTEFSRKSL